MAKTTTDSKIEDIKEYQRKKRVRARRRNLLIGFVSLVICVVTLLIVVSLLLGSSAATRYAFLDEGEVWFSASYPAVVLQAGEPIKAPQDGIFAPLVPGGARVPKDEAVALMVPESAKTQLDETLRLRARLVRHQLSEAAAAHDRLADAYRTETIGRLDAHFDALRLHVSGGNMLGIGTYAAEVAEVMTPVALDIPRGIESIPEAAADLSAYEDALSALKAVSAPIYSNSSGLVAFCQVTPPLLDGTDTTLADLPAALFDDQSTSNLPVLVPRKSGETVATLLTSTSAQIAVFFPDRQLGEMDREQVFSVRRSDQESFYNVRFNRFEAADGGVIGRFLLPTQRADWRLEQQFSLESRLSVTRGLRVPLDCLLEYDPSDGIAILMKVSGGQIQRVPVFVTEADGRFAIIEGRRADPLAPERYDLYVLNPVPGLEGTYID